MELIYSEQICRILHLQQQFFSKSKAQKIILDGANLKYSKFRGTNLSNSILSGSQLFMTDFSGANLKGSEMNALDLTNSIFISANLDNIKLNESNVSGMDLAKYKIDEKFFKKNIICNTILPWKKVVKNCDY